MNLEGVSVRLRAVEPGDIETMYAWENDPSIWLVSGTTAPYSYHLLERFVEGQKFDIFQTRELRLIIETIATREAIGTLDLFDFDPVNCRAGIGILIHDSAQRGKGYASDTLEIIGNYARDVLHMHQLWCNVSTDNTPSLALFRKAGFVDGGTKRDWHRTASGYSDEMFLQKILK